MEPEAADRVERRDKQVLKILGVSFSITVMILAAVVGLAVVAFFILFGFWMSAWGSYK
jgi:hypothetical protein